MCGMNDPGRRNKKQDHGKMISLKIFPEPPTPGTQVGVFLKKERVSSWWDRHTASKWWRYLLFRICRKPDDTLGNSNYCIHRCFRRNAIQENTTTMKYTQDKYVRYFIKAVCNTVETPYNEDSYKTEKTRSLEIKRHST